MGYIYKITNLVNQKIYIGQTNNPKRRWAEHKCIARHNFKYKSALYNAMRFYGIKNFQFQIVEECEDEIMPSREAYYIQQWNTICPNGYNLTPGGEKVFGQYNPFFGKHHSDETKKKISEKNKGRKFSQEEREACCLRNARENNPFYGKHHSDATKQRIREANIANGTYQALSQRMRENNPNKDGRAAFIPVTMIDKITDDELMCFQSVTAAGEYIKALKLTNAYNPTGQICAACKGIQKTAFGFKWKYTNKV